MGGEWSWGHPPHCFFCYGCSSLFLSPRLYLAFPLPKWVDGVNKERPPSLRGRDRNKKGGDFTHSWLNNWPFGNLFSLIFFLFYFILFFVLAERSPYPTMLRPSDGLIVTVGSIESRKSIDNAIGRRGGGECNSRDSIYVSLSILPFISFFKLIFSFFWFLFLPLSHSLSHLVN